MLSAPLPRVYEETGPGGKVAPVNASQQGGGGQVVLPIGGSDFNAEELTKVSKETSKKLESEVLAPMERWMNAYSLVQQRMTKLEALRLEVDSRRRTVATLGKKVRAGVCGSRRGHGSSCVRCPLTAAAAHRPACQRPLLALTPCPPPLPRYSGGPAALAAAPDAGQGRVRDGEHDQGAAAQGEQAERVPAVVQGARGARVPPAHQPHPRHRLAEELPVGCDWGRGCEMGGGGESSGVEWGHSDGGVVADVGR